MKTKYYLSALLFSLSCHVSSISAAADQQKMKEAIDEELSKLFTWDEVLPVLKEAYDIYKEENEYELTQEDMFSFTVLKLLIIDRITDPAQFQLPFNQATFDQLKGLFLMTFPLKLKEVPQNPYWIEKVGFTIPIGLLLGTWAWKIVLVIGGSSLPLQFSGKQVAAISIGLIIFLIVELICKLNTIYHRLQTAGQETLKEIVYFAQQQASQRQPFNVF